MVSEFAARCTTFVVKLGIFFRIFPATFNNQNHAIIMKHPHRFSLPCNSKFGVMIPTHKCFPLLYIIIQIAHDIYLTYFFLHCEYSLFDIIVAVIIGTCISGMTFLAELNYFFEFGNIAALVNSFWILDQKFCKLVSLFEYII